MSDLSFERLPPTILSPTAREAVAAVTAKDAARSVASQWYGDVIGGNATTGWVVQLYADPPGYTVTCGADVSLGASSIGQRVKVGFFDDGSMAIVAQI